MKNQLTVNKVPLEDFINLLINLYEEGANFIDMTGINEDNKDFVRVIVRDEYMEKEKKEEAPLCDEDIDKLIG